MSKDIFILGVGRNTIVTIDLAIACGYRVAGLYHYRPDRVGESYHGFKIIGCNDDLWSLPHLDGNYAISVGDNCIRAEIFDKIRSRGGTLPSLLHPRCVVSDFAKLGMGVMVHANSVIEGDVCIGNDCVVNCNDLIAHGVSMGRHCLVASNSVVGAYTNVEDYVMIGSGAVIVSGRVNSVGCHAVVGAGAVVIGDVKANAVVAGNPAKVISSVR